MTTSNFIEIGDFSAQFIEGEDRMMLLKPFVVKAFGKTYTVPMGFTWDGASIPKLGWLVVGTPFDRHHREPSCFHDWAYCGNVPKVIADLIYAAMLFVKKLKAWKCAAEYLAVAIFGASHYKK